MPRVLLLCTLLVATAVSSPALASTDPPPSESAGTTGQKAAEDPVTRREEVVVTATRSEALVVETPASVVTRDMRQLELDGFYAGGDELRGQPGLFFRRGEGDNDDFMFVNVRGVTGNHGNDTFLAMIDGIPFVYPNEEVYMNHLPYPVVETVEIVKGPVSALYGRGGIAGAINYLTRVPGEPVTEMRLFGGSDTFLGGDLAVTRSLGAGTRLLLSANGLTAEGWRDQNERRSASLFAKTVTQLGAGSVLTLWANWLDKRYDTGSAIPTYEDGTLVAVGGGRTAFIGSRDTFNDTRVLFTAARLDQRLSGRWTLRATLHYRDIDTTNELDFYDSFGFQPERNVVTWNGFGSTQDAGAAFAEAQASYRSERLRVVAGVNWERGTLAQEDRWTGQYGFTPDCGFAFFAIEVDWTSGQVVNGDHPCFVEGQLRAITDSTNTFYSGFAQAEIDLHPRVQLTLGGRYDAFERESAQQNGEPLVTYPLQNDTKGNFSPKVALRVRLADRTFAYASYGQGFNSNFGPIWQWDPGQYLRLDVKPTTLDSYEVGLKGQPDERLSYTLAAYAIRQTNRPVFLSNPAAEDDFTQPSTIVTTGQRYASAGLEASVRGRLGGRTTLFATYGFTDAEWDEYVVETFTGTIDLSGNAPTGVPRHAFSAGVEQGLGRGLLLRAWWESYSDYFLTQDNAYEGGGYGLLNAALSWRPSRGKVAGVTLSATNLLDREYEFLFGGRDVVYTAVPGVPLQAKLTVDLRF